MKLVYGIKDKPKFPQLLIFAFQQVLAILAATIAVPTIIGNGMSQSAALFGAGIGTLVYQLFTKFKSPVYLGSSFAFLGSMFAAFGGAVSSSPIMERGAEKNSGRTMKLTAISFSSALHTSWVALWFRNNRSPCSSFISLPLTMWVVSPLHI